MSMEDPTYQYKAVDPTHYDGCQVQLQPYAAATSGSVCDTEQGLLSHSHPATEVVLESEDATCTRLIHWKENKIHIDLVWTCKSNLLIIIIIIIIITCFNIGLFTLGGRPKRFTLLPLVTGP